MGIFLLSRITKQTKNILMVSITINYIFSHKHLHIYTLFIKKRENKTKKQ